MHLEEIQKFLIAQDREVSCQIGDIQCLLYCDNERFFIIADNSRVSVSRPLETLNEQTLAAIHKSLFS